MGRRKGRAPGAAFRWPRGVCLAALIGAALTLAGCTPLHEYIHNGFKVGPNYKRPPAATASDWIDSQDLRVKKDPPADSHWWTVFNDPVLSDLVQTAYKQNLSLREAAFRVLEARARYKIAVGNFFPQVQESQDSYVRQALSETIANRQFTPERWFNIYKVGWNLAWELDFWGRYRRAIEENKAEFNASIEDYDAVLVTLVADVAQAYAQIRTLQAQLAYTRTNVELMRKTLEIVTIRFKDGAVSKLDVTQATTNLENTVALIPPLEVALRETNNQLCILLGIPPEDLMKKLGPGPIPIAPEQVCVGIPCELLRRRPDVRALERRLAAQCARIGIADAAFYPVVTINGVLNFESTPIGLIFNGQSLSGTIGPTITWPILNYGRIKNGVLLQDARFQELVASYQDTVLKANAEVENGLAAFLQAQEQTRAEQRAVQAARESVELVLIQYREGKVDFNRVFLLERVLVDELNRLAQAQGNIALGLIQVYRALGGGWQIRLENCNGGPAVPGASVPTDTAPVVPGDPLPLPRLLPTSLSVPAIAVPVPEGTAKPEPADEPAPMRARKDDIP
jgi:NodT family efflux transporter outer membrane factor (OMF) lipoprotein